MTHENIPSDARNLSARVEKNAPETNEIGTNALKQRGGRVREEYLRVLEGPKGIRALTEIRDNEPIVGAWHRAFSYLVRRAPWFSVAANDEQDALRAQEILTQIMNDMSHTQGDFMNEIVQVPIYGWAYFEKVWKVRRGPDQQDPAMRSDYNDGLFGLRKLAPRPQDSLDHWEFDEQGGLRGMVQRVGMKEFFIPIERAVLFRTDAIKNNPEGRSWLRNVYDPWFRVKNSRDFEGIFMERLGGMPKATLPVQYMQSNAPSELTSIRRYAEDTIRSIRLDEQMGLIFPASVAPNGDKTGFEFDMIFPAGRFDFNQVIERYEIRIAMALMAEMMFLGLRASGTRSLGDTKTDLMKLAISTFLDQVEETFNRFVIRPLMLANGFRIEDIPTWKHGSIDKVDLQAVADYLAPLMGQAAILPTPQLERAMLKLANEANGIDLPVPPDPEADMPVSTPVDGEGFDTFSARDNQDALNGAQVDALRRTLEDIAQRRIPRASGIALISRAFNMSPEESETIVGDIGNGFFVDDVERDR